MGPITAIAERRTSADDVYDHLYSQIVSLNILPGTKMSEVEIARQFEVSRQPVREAFIRLGNSGLLLIRPQKATVVRKFSRQGISNARFIRTAIEVEILRKACQERNEAELALIEENLSAQDKAIDAQDADRFHALDYEFHRSLCSAARCDFAFQEIANNKAQVDRLCMLSLAHEDEMKVLLGDHREIFEALRDRDEGRIVSAIRLHLGRLDGVVEVIRAGHMDYFED